MLTLTIEKKWFDMILSGEKMEEGITLIQNEKGWRDINEELSDPGEYVLVSFENEGVTLPDIATYEVDKQGNGAFYPSDCEATYASVGVFVNAWMPLPEPYKGGLGNADCKPE